MNGNRGIFLPFQPGYHAKEAQRAKVAKIGVALEGETGGVMVEMIFPVYLITSYSTHMDAYIYTQTICTYVFMMKAS